MYPVRTIFLLTIQCVVCTMCNSTNSNLSAAVVYAVCKNTVLVILPADSNRRHSDCTAKCQASFRTPQTVTVGSWENAVAWVGITQRAISSPAQTKTADALGHNSHDSIVNKTSVKFYCSLYTFDGRQFVTFFANIISSTSVMYS